MTSIATISGPISSALTAQAPVLPAVVTEAAAATPVAAPSHTAASPSRFETDPLAGVLVTQFLDNNGDIVSQVPSKTVVAYLQNGLTPDGFAKPQQTSVA